jgi:hypothetical protein
MTTELLEQVAKVAYYGTPLGRVKVVSPDFLCFCHVDDHVSFGIQSDTKNGSGIVAMLEAMDKAGWECDLSVNLSPNVCNRYAALLATEEMSWAGECKKFTGKTRAEAVAKAFVHVFAKGEVTL